MNQGKKRKPPTEMPQGFPSVKRNRDYLASESKPIYFKLIKHYKKQTKWKSHDITFLNNCSTSGNAIPFMKPLVESSTSLASNPLDVCHLWVQPLLAPVVGQLYDRLCSVRVPSVALSVLTASIKCSVACSLLDIYTRISITRFKLVSVSAGLPKVLSSSSLVSSLVVGEYVGGNWFLRAGHLAMFFGVKALAALLPVLALPLGGIVEVDEEEQERN